MSFGFDKIRELVSDIEREYALQREREANNSAKISSLENENKVLQDKVRFFQELVDGVGHDPGFISWLRRMGVVDTPQASAELTELKELESTRGDAVRELLDALSAPSGRDVRKAWDHACMLYGRYGAKLSTDAFVSYFEDLTGARR